MTKRHCTWIGVAVLALAVGAQAVPASKIDDLP
jgi:hypothetical protein